VSDKPRPDPVVKEPEIRAAVDFLAKGHVETQRKIGVTVPSAAAAESFAKEAVESQVKIHEDRCRNGVPEPKRPAPAQADDMDVRRPVGVYDWNTRTNQFRPLGPVRGKQAAPVDPLLQSRMDMLLRLPEWRSRIMKTWDEGLIASNGSFVHASHLVMKIVETSNNVFGDWRTPKQSAPKIIVSG